jgi:hypothetical protein
VNRAIVASQDPAWSCEPQPSLKSISPPVTSSVTDGEMLIAPGQRAAGQFLLSETMKRAYAHRLTLQCEALMTL